MTQDQAAKQAVLALAQDKDKAQDQDLVQVPDRDKVPVQDLVQAPDKVPAQVKVLVPDKALAQAKAQVPDRVPDQDNRVQVISQDQALVALELLQAKSQKTHIPTSFIPEMAQSNMVASLTATAVLTPTITPMAIPTTVIPQTTISKISTEKMDKAEENNPPLSPRLRKVSISKGYKQLGSRTNQEKKEYQNNGRKRANDSRIQ